ncbi:N-6 DNA methylase [Halorubellus sp. JP-L1]|uniref:Eco57I restriction-modification methylase domain-containing protein n=1 Tax=Halorubellus sp. JP-L1 TaxID=2715753 RepID=UPI00140DF548|nr:N-6 DNA methylase [Halorubellus sp. JP-L1]
MKGFVATPPDLTNRMVELLFQDHPPTEEDQILYPGVGEGPFIEAVHDYCQENDTPIPTGYACDTHQERLETTEARFADLPVQFEVADFLERSFEFGDFDYIIGNPPYVPITEIDDENKAQYREAYETATDRFDLYLLFFERALEVLDDDGRLAFITPEKFEYTETAEPLRRLLSQHHLERLEHLDETTFDGYITYPTISVVNATEADETAIITREGTKRTTTLPTDGTRWTEFVRDIDASLESTGVTLGDVTERISVGVATGADSVFEFDAEELPSQFEPWSVPTISGKQLEKHPLGETPQPSSVFVCPYDDRGTLIPFGELGALGEWLDDIHRSRLEDRSCYEGGGRRWYAWHDNPPMDDLIQEKILFRDITDAPRFWVDTAGDIVPKHSVYYLVPKDDVDIEDLQTYLNSPPVAEWLQANCQQARDDYLRLQTRVLEDLPVPPRFSAHRQVGLDIAGE